MHTEKTIRLTILHTNDLHGRVAQLTRIATACPGNSPRAGTGRRLLPVSGCGRLGRHHPTGEQSDQGQLHECHAAWCRL